MQASRGCGFAGHAGEGEHLIRHDKKKGGCRYVIKECPISIVQREATAFNVFTHWQLLGRPPFDYNTVGQALWLKTSALHAEAKWAENQVGANDG